MTPARFLPLFRIAALTALLSIALPARASADWQFTPLVGITFAGGTTIIDLENGAEESHWHFGGAATWLGDGPIGFEGFFVRTPHFFQSDKVSFESVNVTTLTSSYSMALMGNVVVAAPLKWNEYGLRPFVSGGLGLIRVGQEPKESAFLLEPFDLNLLGWNAGGGAIGFLTERTGLRFEVRYFRSLSNPASALTVPAGETRLSYWTGSVGLVFRY